MSLIELERVRYRYETSNTYALDDINLKIDASEFVLLAAASGSGKSTLCRLLNGLIPHFYGGSLEGHVIVDGLNTREHRVAELYSRVGLVFQNADAQLFNSTVERECAFGLESLGLSRDEIHARVDWVLDAARLTPLAQRAPHSLSGGEQQTVALAAILALRPSVLVLDEPFANLDPENTARILAILRDVHARGTTILLAEHRLHTVIQYATRLLVLDHGHIVRDGEPRAVLRDDLTPYRLHIPYVVRYAREAGWRETPLSVEEAIPMLRERGLATMTLRRNGSSTRRLDAPRVVEFRNVSFEQEGKEILTNINLELDRSECVALVGKNGSGKTTLLKHLNALHRPTRGNVIVLDQNTRTAAVSHLAREVAIVFQNPNDQLFKPNVREEVEVAPRALKRFDTARLETMYNSFELRPLLDRSPFTLSEGEKKRVAFASAMAARPRIIALDEPTTGQDYSFRTALVQLLRELLNEGITIFFATHDLGFAEEIASRWIVLADGKLIAQGTPDEVMANDAAMTHAALRPTARFRLAREALARNAMLPTVNR